METPGLFIMLPNVDYVFITSLFCAKNMKIEKMSLEQITPELITDFLDYLESTMKYSASSRNQRLAALRTFFRYLMHDDVTYISLTQDVLSIPMKKTKNTIPEHLSLSGIFSSVLHLEKSLSTFLLLA